MLQQVKTRLRILPIEWFLHNCGPGLPKSIGASTLVIHLTRFLEEHFSQNFLFLVVSIVILNVVVMRLVEHSRRVVITIRILVPDPSHLIYDLSLSGVGTQGNLIHI